MSNSQPSSTFGETFKSFIQLGEPDPSLLERPRDWTPPKDLVSRLKEQGRPSQEIMRVLQGKKQEMLKELGVNKVATAKLNHQIKTIRCLCGMGDDRRKPYTLQERMIAALGFGPATYKAVYPRRYRELKTHVSPRHLMILAAASGITFQQYLKDEGLNPDTLTPEDLQRIYDDPTTDDGAVRGWQVVGALIDNMVPTYYLDQDTCEELLDADCRARVSFQDFDWPHPAMLLILPRGLFPNSPVFLTAHWTGTSARFIGLTEEPADFNQSFFQFTFDGDKLIEEGVDSILGDIKKREGLSKEVKGPLLEYAENVMALAVNAILAMVAEPPLEENPSHPTRPANVRSPVAPRGSNDSWSPNFFSVQRSPKAESGDGSGTGSGTKRVHVRRGHWMTKWRVDEEGVIEAGKRVIWTVDRRKAFKVAVRDGDAVLLRDARGIDHAAHVSELKVAQVELVRIKRQIIGLKKLRDRVG